MISFEEMLYLPHHVSPTRPKMSLSDRAAQFSPFATLPGFGEAVEEKARLTEQEIQLTADELDRLNERMTILKQNIAAQPQVKITYFKKDDLKSGGAYLQKEGQLKKIDDSLRSIFFTDGEGISFDCVIDVESDCFNIF